MTEFFESQVSLESDLKLNCWEFKNCGKEPGGKNNGGQGTCPAASDTRLDGVHGGRNAGRACWALAGTLCKGVPHGNFARKFQNCHECDFFRTVVREEGAGFVFTIKLHEMLNNPAVRHGQAELADARKPSQ